MKYTVTTYTTLLLFTLALQTQAAFLINNADYAEVVQTGVDLDAVDDWWIHGPDASTETFSKKVGSGITLTAQGGGVELAQNRTEHTYLWSTGSGTVDNPSSPAAHDPNSYRRRQYAIGLLGGASTLDLSKGAYYTVDVAAGNTGTNLVTVYGMGRRNDEIYVEAVLRDSGKTLTRATLSPQLLGTQSDLQGSTELSFSFSFLFHADVASDVLSFTIAGYNDAATTDRSLGIDAVTVEPGEVYVPPAFIQNGADYAEVVKTGVNLDRMDDWWIHGPDEVTDVFSEKTGSGITLTAQGGGLENTAEDRTDHTYVWSSGSGTLDNPSDPADHNPFSYRRREYDAGLLGGAPTLDLTKGVYYSVDVVAGNTGTNKVTVYGMARRNDEIYVESTVWDSSKTVTNAVLAPQLIGSQSDTGGTESFCFSLEFHAKHPSDIFSFTIAGYNDNAATVDRSLALDAVTRQKIVPSRIVDTEVVGDALKLVIDARKPLGDLMLVRKGSLTHANWSLTTYSDNGTNDDLKTDLSDAVETTNGYYEVYIPLVHDSDFYAVDEAPQSEWYGPAAISDSSVTTHDLVSGEMTVGVTAHGGGIINRISLPGYGDIMGPQADPYGRGGQSAIRDQLHGLVYNPTQGGFHDTAGTVCRINTAADGRALVVAPRPCTLFRGDGQHDFTEWENLVTDRYNDDGGNSDSDLLDESGLVGQQATEITSEFDFYATYEDQLGTTGSSFGGSSEISIPAVRHYYEYRYIRNPGHCISQFNQGSHWEPWTGDVSDISVVNPSGTHADTPNDLGVMIFSISIRIDRPIWTPTHIGLVSGSSINDLTMLLRPPTDPGNKGLTLREFHYDPALQARAPNAPRGTPTSIDVPLFLFADSDDIDAPGALGLYYPDSRTNEFSVIGVDRESGAIVYEDDRRMQTDLRDVAFRTPNMSWCGFRGSLTGLLNPTRLPATQYEAMRGEYYLLYGTPREIFENAQRIQSF